MATINKDFKIKSGLIVEGTNATVNGNQILTETASDSYILDLIGGETLVKSVSGNLAVDGAGDLSINESGLATDLAGGYLYTDGSSLNVDIEGLENDGFVTVNGIQTLTNKTINDELFFTNPATANNDGGIKVDNSNEDLIVHAYTADLELIATGDVNVTSNNGDVNLNVDGWAKINGQNIATEGYADQAQTDAQAYADSLAVNYDAAGSASTAQGNAEDYADGLISTEVTNRNSAIATAKGEAIDSAEGYTDSAISTEVTNRNSAIDSAISTEVTNRNSAISTAKLQAIQDANDYTDGEISALVDSAPALLDTLNELAAAIADNPNYATDAANAVAGRVAKAGDTMTGALTLSGAPTLDLHASTKKYVDDQAYLADMSARGYADGVAGDAYDNALADANSYTDTTITNLNLGTTYDAYGAAAGAEEAANLYTDGEITTALTTAQGYATTAQGNAEDYTDSAISTEVTNRNTAITNAVNAIDTDVVEEGTGNLYFTDSRAKASAADLLTGATKTNITITGSGAGLTITAENGVADSTTDDLDEGAINLYFTPQRAIDAQTDADITPNSVKIANFRKEEATQQYVGAASTVDVHTFQYPYESAKYLVRVVGNIAGVRHSQLSEILVTIDGNKNIAIMEYGITHTSDAPLASFSARAWTGSSDFTSLTATTAVSGCEIIAAATMLSWAD